MLTDRHIFTPDGGTGPVTLMSTSVYARSGNVTEGYATDWTVEQLRAHAQKIADRIDELMHAEPDGAIEPAPLVKEPGGP